MKVGHKNIGISGDDSLLRRIIAMAGLPDSPNRAMHALVAAAAHLTHSPQATDIAGCEIPRPPPVLFREPD
jgi:hypothetical protein